MQYQEAIEIRGVRFVDGYSPFRERMRSLRDGLLLLLGILLAPLAMAAYVGLTLLLFLPLLGLRRVFPRRSTSVLRWDGDTPLDSRVGSRRHAATGSA
jgi:hypothetical protein